MTKTKYRRKNLLRVSSFGGWESMVVGQRPRARTPENLHLRSTNKRLGKRHTGSKWLWNLKACPQWDTFSNETTSPNPFKPFHRLGTKYPNPQAYGVILPHTPHDLSTSAHHSALGQYTQWDQALTLLPPCLPPWRATPLSFFGGGGYSHCSRDFLWGAGASCPQLMQKWRQWKKSTVKSSTPRTTKHKRLWGGKQGWGNTKSRHQKTSMSAKLNLNFTKLLDVMIMNNSHMRRAWPEHLKTLGHRSRYQTSQPNPKK